MERRDFILLRQFNTIPISAKEAPTWLGRIVQDFEDPRSFQTPPINAGPLPLQCSPPDDSLKVSGILEANKNKHIFAHLCEALGVSADSNTTKFESFKAERVRQFRLDTGDDEEAFRQVLARPGVAAKVKEKGFPLYFVVGFLLTREGLKHKSEQAVSRSVAATLDLDQIVPATTSLPVNPISASLGGQSASGAAVSANELGSRVFAFRYKVITRHLRFGKPRLGASGPQTDQAFSDGESDEGEEVADEVDEKDIFLSDLPLAAHEGGKHSEQVFIT